MGMARAWNLGVLFISFASISSVSWGKLSSRVSRIFEFVIWEVLVVFSQVLSVVSFVRLEVRPGFALFVVSLSVHVISFSGEFEVRSVFALHEVFVISFFVVFVEVFVVLFGVLFVEVFVELFVEFSVEVFVEVFVGRFVEVFVKVFVVVVVVFAVVFLMVFVASKIEESGPQSTAGSSVMRYSRK